MMYESKEVSIGRLWDVCKAELKYIRILIRTCKYDQERERVEKTV